MGWIPYVWKHAQWMVGLFGNRGLFWIGIRNLIITKSGGLGTFIQFGPLWSVWGFLYDLYRSNNN